MYPVVSCWAKCLKNHNVITMYPLDTCTLTPSESRLDAVETRSLGWRALPIQACSFSPIPHLHHRCLRGMLIQEQYHCIFFTSKWWSKFTDVTFRSDWIRTYQRDKRKGESDGQLSTVHTRTHAGNTRVEERRQRRPELNQSFRAFRRTSERYEWEESNISSEVARYK